MPLPTNTSPLRSRQDHVNDHDALHAQFNTLEPLVAEGLVTQTHLDDATDAHDASAISFSPTGTIAATDVQAAIAEVAAEAGGGGGGGGGLPLDFLLASGMFYTSPGSGQVGTLTPEAGSTWLYAIPFPVAVATTFSFGSLRITLGLANQFGRFGIYGPGTGSLKGQPGPRLFQSELIALQDASAALISVNLELAAGLHWLAWKSMPTGAGYSVRSLTNGQSIGMPSDYEGTDTYVGWQVSDAVADSVLPNPFPTVGASHRATNVPRLFLGTYVPD